MVVGILTNCLYRRHSSSALPGLLQDGQIWQSSEGDAHLGQPSHRRGRHGHDQCTCESESLFKNQYESGADVLSNNSGH